MDPFSLMGLLGGLGQIGGGIAGMFGGHKNNPSKGAIGELNNIPGQVGGYYKPYQDAGNQTLQSLMGQYGDLVNNPGKKFGELGAGYKESPGYQKTLMEALSGANNAAAMGGQLGTPQHQDYAAQAGGNVANEDYEKYMQHILGLYGTGLGGQQGIEKQGYDANTDYANLLANLGQQKSQLKYAGQAGKNAANARNWGNIFGGVAQAGSGYFMGPHLEQMFNQSVHGG